MVACKMIQLKYCIFMLYLLYFEINYQNNYSNNEMMCQPGLNGAEGPLVHMLIWTTDRNLSSDHSFHGRIRTLDPDFYIEFGRIFKRPLSKLGSPRKIDEIS